MKKIIVGLAMGIATLSMLFGSQTAFAVTCPDGTPGAGRGDVKSLAECSLSDTEDTFMTTLQQILNVVIAVLGFVAVAVIILGGFTYITSNGDASKLTKAKNTIIYGVIGLVVALLAFAIVNFVLDSVFGGEKSSDDSGDDVVTEAYVSGKKLSGTSKKKN